MPVLPSPEEIEAAKTPKGAWTRAQLAEWGVPWPPPKGWKDELMKRWEATQPDGVPPPQHRPDAADFAQETLDFG